MSPQRNMSSLLHSYAQHYEGSETAALRLRGAEEPRSSTLVFLQREKVAMHVQATSLPEVKVVSPKIFRDDRGFFLESYSRRSFAAALQIDPEFVQDNHSRSDHAGVVRGLHFQVEPNVQGKLVRVVAGAIFDVAVDIRVGSPTYGRHMSIILDARDHRQVWIPAGFAHGFCTLTPGTEVVYKVTAPYEPACDRGLAWDDPALQIPWPVASDAAILSPKDFRHPRLSDLPAYFAYAPDADAN